MVCARDRVTQAELLSEYLRPFVEQHDRRVQQEVAERVRRMDGGPG